MRRVRVRLEGWRRVSRRLGWRSLALLVVGFAVMLFGAFWAWIGTLMAMTTETTADIQSGVFCAITGGLVPIAVGAVLVAFGVRDRVVLNRMRLLAAFVRKTSGDHVRVETKHVAEALGLPLDRAELLVLDAASAGVIVDDDAAPPPPQPLALAGTLGPGAVINATWRIEGLLGSGGMGHVYDVSHVRTGRRYALKTLLPDARLSVDALRRFEREARAASALGHPGIVAVHDFDRTSDGLAFLVMDRLEGETLEARLEKRGTLTWDETRRIAGELAEALAAAHAAGLLHRDVKPANVFLSRSGSGERAVLLDFGLAKPVEDAKTSRLTATGAAIGTPLYMSPEQARGEPVDVRSDIYGLAAVVYEMVTGAPPFLEPTAARAYARLLSEPAIAPSRLSPLPLPAMLDDLLDRALAKDPGLRPTSVDAFRSELLRLTG
jgi:tRNA A-37 threonylcarbamoyl transferase component Bud32